MADDAVGYSAVAVPQASSRHERVYLIEEYDRRRRHPRFPEYFSDRLFGFPHPFREDLGTLDRDEVGFTFSRHSPCEQSLAAARRTEEKNSLWRLYPHSCEDLCTLYGPFNRLPQTLLDFFKVANLVPVNGWDLYGNLSHGGRSDLLEGVEEVVHRNLHLLQNAWRYPLLFKIDLRQVASQSLHRRFAA